MFFSRGRSFLEESFALQQAAFFPVQSVLLQHNTVIFTISKSLENFVRFRWTLKLREGSLSALLFLTGRITCSLE